MKTLLFSYKFLFITLLYLPLALCSSDNDNESESETPFSPVNIDLTTGVNIEVDDTSFSKQGYNFTTYRVTSNEQGIDGISIAYPDSGNNPSSIVLNLDAINGISSITVSLFNNCGNGCTSFQIINDGNVIEELNTNDEIPTGIAEVTIDVSELQIDALRLSSFEAILYSIALE